MKPLFGCLFGAILLTTTATVHADTLFDRYFANVDSGKPCYTRMYDALRRDSRRIALVQFSQ